MQTKILEIRDTGTYIAVLAVDINPADEIERYYMRRYGYPCDGAPNVLITHLSGDGDPASNDPYSWHNPRTWGVAHNYIIDHWAELKTGDVVDVQFILGETKTVKAPERSEPWPVTI